MKSRNLNPAQLADADSILGDGCEFKPEHDRANAGKPLPPAIELAPVGPPATVYEFKPEHDLVNAGKSLPPMVELTPADPPPVVLEFKPEEDKANSAKKRGKKKTRKPKKPPTGEGN